MKENNFISEYKTNRKSKDLKRAFGFLWIIKTEIIILIIIFLGIGILNIIPNKVKYQVRYTLGKIHISSKHSNKYDFKSFEKAINKNENLEKNQKEFIKNSLKPELKENEKYIDFKEISEKFSKLKIEETYNLEKEKFDYRLENSNKDIAGKYNMFSNKITIYKNAKSDSKNEHILFHEINHICTNSNRILNRNILTEVVNELFAREYNETTRGIISGQEYREYMPYIYVLAEILPDKVIREYKFENREEIVVSALLEINNNIENAYGLIESMNELNHKETIKYLSIFYKSKFKADMSKDKVILAYLSQNSKQFESELKILLNLPKNIKILDIIPKGYISEEYKDSNNKVIVKIMNNGEKQEINFGT